MAESYPDADAKLKEAVTDKYAEYLHVVDKESYAQALLYYAHNKFPQHRGNFSGAAETGNLELWKDMKLKSKAHNAWLLNTYVMLAIEDKDYDAFSMKNAFSSIYMPRRSQLSSEQ
jgi:hypothetical protein